MLQAQLGYRMESTTVVLVASKRGHRRTAGAPIPARLHPTATATVRRGAAPPPRRGKSTQLGGCSGFDQHERQRVDVRSVMNTVGT